VQATEKAGFKSDQISVELLANFYFATFFGFGVERLREEF
jgi:hypothetical protein